MTELSLAAGRTLAALKAHRTRNEMAMKDAKGAEKKALAARVADFESRIAEIEAPKPKARRRGKPKGSRATATA